MGYFPPGLPGFPGQGLPATRDSSQPIGSGSEPPAIDGGAPSSVIVNRTLFHSYSLVSDGAIPIPPTTLGNTLVVVQMSGWFRSRPVFNDICAGYPIDYFDDPPINTQGSGYSGSSSGFPNGFNSGSALAYWTNIPGGVTQISYPSNWHNTINSGFIPTFGIVYELVPCTVISLLGTADVSDSTTTPPDLAAYAIGGPLAQGFYISSVVYEGVSPLSGAFSAVSAPWVLDYQELWNDPNNAVPIAGAVAIIASGSGTQQATFTWGGSSASPSHPYGAVSICLLPNSATGGNPNLTELSQFLPNVWITC